ncbi:MAG: bifunctional N(6)-L-threonylcarbamoyladenine synthase/serine/threonine protein kinase [Halobacteriales archaeon]
MTRVLGIEGTAWAASAAVFDADRDAVRMESEAYQPDSGGIHPREAAEHMHDAIPQVVESVLGDTDDPVDAVAFSRGPGLGPCLRTAGTAARALAGTLGVPLVGVNHMVAHLEIGRRRSGFSAPVCLNASGANAHLLGFHSGRYRVLGETMDTGVGNAIDKFARHVGWDHPGGPKVEEAAREGEYVELPYVVKGMDFSFAGITSAAQDAIEDGTPVADVCRGLEETIFAMLTEVSERALSLTGRDELVLGGGVGQNRRLRGMLEAMCGARGASFFAPADRFLRDNAGMIAVLGAEMYEAGDTIPIDDSAVRPGFRPDQVPVTWRSDEPAAHTPERNDTASDHDEIRGAEAVVEIGDRVNKRRIEKPYRHPDLDARLRAERTAAEARLTSLARRQGVATPVLWDIDPEAARLVFEHVGEADLGDAPTEPQVRRVGEHLAAIHDAGVVHGDPTVRNVRVDPGTEWVYLIDFGLGYHTRDVEDYAMDLHVFEQSITGTAADHESLCRAFEEAYREAGSESVIDRLRDIEDRGRYQEG